MIETNTIADHTTAEPTALEPNLNQASPVDLRATLEDFSAGAIVVLSFCIPEEKLDSVPGLSAAENDIVRHVAKGRSNLQIARARGSSPRTVANQLQSIYQKLGVFSRAELLRKVRQRAMPGSELERKAS